MVQQCKKLSTREGLNWIIKLDDERVAPRITLVLDQIGVFSWMLIAHVTEAISKAITVV